MADLSDLFRSLRWRHYRIEQTSPHALYVTHTDGGKVAVLVLRRGRPEGDWALSATALDYIAKGLRDGRLVQAFIVAADRWTVIASATVTEVLARIGDTKPNDGVWGPYFWLDGTLKPVADYRATVDETEPW